MKKITSARQIGQVIRKKRTALGLSQQQLADAAHVSRGFINRIEKGASTAVYPDKLLDVLKALSLSLLVEGQNAPQPESLKEKQIQEQQTDPSPSTSESIPATAPPEFYNKLQIDLSLLKKRHTSGADSTSTKDKK